jgi:anion-transporting  ArsA/GET3 family ATPase
MTPLYDRRFLFITGKGGVGKTTVTMALALGLAARGKRVLCAACNAKERFSTVFGTAPVGPTVVPLTTNVWGVNLDPARSMEEYGLMFLKSKALYRAVFDNRYVRSFFRAAPGLYEWAMLGKAWWHSTDEAAAQGQGYDVVLLDAPATGHGLDMLRVPKVIVDVVPPGILRRDAERAWATFRDPDRGGVVVVTLPEDMPVNETLELLGSLRGELGLPVARCVVNGVLPPLFRPDERKALLAPRVLRADDPGEAALAAGVRRATRELVQAQSVERLRASAALPTTYLPFLFDDAASLGAVRLLARGLEAPPTTLRWRARAARAPAAPCLPGRRRAPAARPPRATPSPSRRPPPRPGDAATGTGRWGARGPTL